MSKAIQAAPDPIVHFLTLISRLSEAKPRGRKPVAAGQIRELVESLPAKLRESALAVLEIDDAPSKKAKDSLAAAIQRVHQDVLALIEEFLEESIQDFNRNRLDRALEYFDRGTAILQLIPGKRASFMCSIFVIFKEMTLGQQKHLERGDAEALDEAVNHLRRANRLAQDLTETLPAEMRNKDFERMLVGLQVQCHFLERGLANRRKDEREEQRLVAEFGLLIRDIQSRLGPGDEMLPTLVAFHTLPDGISSFHRSMAAVGAFDFEGAHQHAARAQAALRSFSDAFRKEETVLLASMNEFFLCMLQALDVHELTLRMVSAALQGKVVKSDVTSIRDSGKRLQDAAERMAALKNRVPAALASTVENTAGLFGSLKERLTNLAVAFNTLGPRGDLTGSFDHAATGYQFLEEPCRRLLEDHPDAARNVFIMTPYDKAVAKVLEALEDALREAGLNPLRADGKNYLKDRNLWHNVCVYMLCCGSGIAVLENQARREFNPNVALEYGFMRALDKRVLLLTEKNFKAIRADIGGVVRESFDARRPNSVATAVGRWLRDFEKSSTPRKAVSSKKRKR
jgi:tetratricopeptide (TPR) repeat protein/nucleoside 2-deoxyribosyltransferase